MSEDLTNMLYPGDLVRLKSPVTAGPTRSAGLDDLRGVWIDEHSVGHVERLYRGCGHCGEEEVAIVAFVLSDFYETEHEVRLKVPLYSLSLVEKVSV